MTTGPSSIVAAAIAAQPCPDKSDQLEILQLNAAVARDTALAIAGFEEQLKVAQAILNNLYQKVLPELMDKAGVDCIGIQASGNKPAMDFKLRPFYSANIAASWSQERKAIAFAFLEERNAADLIKTEVVASLPKGNLALAQKLVKAASELKIPTILTKRVHGNTLSAWLRELVESHATILSTEDLEKIGGTIGRVVKPEERKI